jgi:hypothetical protein
MLSSVKAVIVSSPIPQTERRPSSGSISMEISCSQPVLVLAKHLGNATDAEDVAYRGHDQAAWLSNVRDGQFHEQLVEPMGGMVGDMREDVGDRGLRIDIVQPGGDDDAVHNGDAPAAAARTAEQPRFSVKSDTEHRALGRVVRETDASVVEEPRNLAKASKRPSA